MFYFTHSYHASEKEFVLANHNGEKIRVPAEKRSRRAAVGRSGRAGASCAGRCPVPLASPSHIPGKGHNEAVSWLRVTQHRSGRVGLRARQAGPDGLLHSPLAPQMSQY